MRKIKVSLIPSKNATAITVRIPYFNQGREKEIQWNDKSCSNTKQNALYLYPADLLTRIQLCRHQRHGKRTI